MDILERIKKAKEEGVGEYTTYTTAPESDGMSIMSRINRAKQDKTFTNLDAAAKTVTAVPAYVSYADYGKGLLDRVNETEERAMKLSTLLDRAPAAIRNQDQTLKRTETEADSVFRSGTWKTNPIVSKMYVDLYNRRNMTAEKLETMKSAYNSLLTDAQKARDEYLTAVEDYNGFYGFTGEEDTSDGFRVGSGAAWNRWRLSIRDEAEIEADIDAADREIERINSTDDPELAAKLTGNEGTLRRLIEYIQSSGDYAGDMGDVAKLQAAYGVSPEKSGSTSKYLADLQRLSSARGSVEEQEKKKELLNEELKMSKYLKWEDLRGNKDFAANSAYVPKDGWKGEYNAISGRYTINDHDAFDYEYVNKNPEAKGAAMVNDVQSDAAFLGVDRSFLEEMEPEEISMYNYVFATQGAEKAREYLRDLETSLTARQREKSTEEWRKYAAENPTEASAFSVLTSPLKTLSYMGQTADYLRDGEIDQNAGYNKFSYANSAVRDEVAKKIEASGEWGKVGSFLYQTAMSMVDFVYTAAISGGFTTGGNEAAKKAAERVSLAIMGTGAAADSVIEAKDRGLSDNKAFALGTIAGIAEIVTEKVSLETLLNGTKWSKSAVGYFLANTIAEGSEEGASDLINWAADVLIAQDQSQWREDIRDLMAAHPDWSEDKAFGEALKNKAAEIGLDVLGGAISGGLMAIPNSANMAISSRALGSGIQMGGMDATRALIAEGRSYGPKTPAAKLAADLQNKINSGGTPTKAELGYLEMANRNAAEEQRAKREKEEKKKKKNKSAPESGAEIGLVPVSENMRQSLSTGKNNIVARTAADIVTFVKNALQKKGGPERLYMGTIPDLTASLIKESTGVDVTGYNAILPGNSVQHIFNHHGDEQTEAQRGQRAVTAEDISLIPQVLASPDSVTLSKDTDADGRRVLIFTKQVGDTIVTAQAVTDGRHAITTSSLWVQNKKSPLVTTPNARTSDPSLGFDVRNAPPSGSSGANVAQIGSAVNVEAQNIAPESGAEGTIDPDMTKKGGNPTQELNMPKNGLQHTPKAPLDPVGPTGTNVTQSSTVVNSGTQNNAPGAEIKAAATVEERALTDENINTAAQTAEQKGVYIDVGENVRENNAGTGPERATGAYTGEQARGVARGAIQIPEGTNAGRAAVLRSTYAQNSGLQKVSSKSLGISTGTERANLTVLPRESYDEALKSVSEKVYRDAGMEVTFVTGAIEINGKRGTQLVRGVCGDGQMIVQADNRKYTPEQIADHEIFHRAVEITPGLRSEMRERIAERFTPEQLQKDIEKYQEAVAGAYDLDADNLDPEQLERILAQVEELMADAYAGINSFGARASRYNETAREVMRGQGFGTQAGRAEAKTTRGPPSGTKYSIGDRGYYEGADLSNDESLYTYDFLTDLPDMKVTALPELKTLRGADGFVDKVKVVSDGMKNAATVGTVTDGNTFVRNSYTGRLLRVDVSSIRHGLNGTANRLYVNSELGASIGDVVKNAVPVNALKNTAHGVKGTYAMAALCEEKNGHQVVAVVTVEERDGNIVGLEAYDVTHAVSGRQKRSERVGLKSPQGVYPSTNASTISIDDFLKIVNTTHQSIQG